VASNQLSERITVNERSTSRKCVRIEHIVARVRSCILVYVDCFDYFTTIINFGWLSLFFAVALTFNYRRRLRLLKTSVAKCIASIDLPCRRSCFAARAFFNAGIYVETGPYIPARSCDTVEIIFGGGPLEGRKPETFSREISFRHCGWCLRNFTSTARTKFRGDPSRIPTQILKIVSLKILSGYAHNACNFIFKIRILFQFLQLFSDGRIGWLGATHPAGCSRNW
jgi:hypothetical protein